MSLLRDRLARATVLAKLESDVEETAAGLADTALHLGDLSRPVMLQAYDIAKSHAQTDGAVAKAVKPALDFYARAGRIAAATKRKKKT